MLSFNGCAAHQLKAVIADGPFESVDQSVEHSDYWTNVTRKQCFDGEFLIRAL